LAIGALHQTVRGQAWVENFFPALNSGHRQLIVIQNFQFEVLPDRYGIDYASRAWV